MLWQSDIELRFCRCVSLLLPVTFSYKSITSSGLKAMASQKIRRTEDDCMIQLPSMLGGSAGEKGTRDFATVRDSTSCCTPLTQTSCVRSSPGRGRGKRDLLPRTQSVHAPDDALCHVMLSQTTSTSSDEWSPSLATRKGKKALITDSIEGTLAHLEVILVDYTLYLWCV